MTLLTAFLLQVIIPYLILYRLLLSGDTGGSADASEYPRERLE
jgi:hypothetical protein